MPGVPGRGGPPPKRSDQRRRANKTEGLEKAITSEDQEYGRSLINTKAHTALGRRCWEAARHSGQAQFYEATDWWTVELLVHSVDAYMQKPRAGMLASIQALMTSLLFTEGDRRRARLELEREAPVEEAPDASNLDEYRRRLRACD